MAIITTYPDDATTTDSDKFLTSDSSGATKLTAASTIKTYILAQNNVPATALATSAIKLGVGLQTGGNFSITNAGYTQIPGMTVTVTFPAGGRDAIIEAYFPQLSLGGQYTAVIGLWDGVVSSGTKLQEGGYTTVGGGVNDYSLKKYLSAPAAGSKTYNIGFSTNGSTSSITSGQSSTVQPYVLVTLI